MPTLKKAKIVCFGGGTGLPSLLQGLKYNPWLEITAVVNMFDSGGSSGELRDQFGILPPGDILRCLLSLSMDDHGLGMRKALLQRIQNEKHPGHTAGNVLLMGLEEVYGDYHAAVDALGQILFAQGEVLPVTLAQSHLCARYTDGTRVKGEVNVDDGVKKGKIVKEIYLDPEVSADVRAITAIKNADVLCVGPGSFYTSVLANFLPAGIKEAIVNSKAPIILIMNLLTEGAGMKNDTAKKIVAEAERYLGRPVARIMMNDKIPAGAPIEEYAEENKYPLLYEAGTELESRTAAGVFWIDPLIARHDPKYLASAITNEVVKLKPI